MSPVLNYFKKDKDYYLKKERLLRSAAISILNDPEHTSELEQLRLNLGLNINEIIDTYINYDLDISKNTNEIYQSIIMRYILHMHNLLKESWHIERQKTVIDFIKIASPSSIVDMGFGVPGKYVKEYLKFESTQSFITLCDIDESAITFSQALLNLWTTKKWTSRLILKKVDMNDGTMILDQDLYIFQSSIEHVTNCTDYLKVHVNRSKEKAYFLISLPLGDITPEHFYEWKTSQEACNWINSCGLSIVQSKVIKVNPKVDIFADYHNFNYYDFFILCNKNRL